MVLVVDDDAGVRVSLKFTLEMEGFEVRTYSSAQELLNENSLPASSCLVTDYHMPAMTGLELVDRLRDRRMSIPAILITSLPNEICATGPLRVGFRLSRNQCLAVAYRMLFARLSSDKKKSSSCGLLFIRPATNRIWLNAQKRFVRHPMAADRNAYGTE